jgi:hypothetical protein
MTGFAELQTAIRINAATGLSDWLPDSELTAIDDRLDSGSLPSWAECVSLMAEVKEHRRSIRLTYLEQTGGD